MIWTNVAATAGILVGLDENLKLSVEGLRWFWGRWGGGGFQFEGVWGTCGGLVWEGVKSCSSLFCWSSRLRGSVGVFMIICA